jgi:serine protease Do
MKSQLKTIVIATVFAFLLNLFFGRGIAASLSTWGFLNRLGLISPQAPIVINNREEIRLSDNGQATEAVNAAKSKVAAVYRKATEALEQVGMAVNLSSDGVFVAAKETVSQKGEYYIALADGRTALVNQIAFDPASGLAFLQSSLQNVPTAEFSDSQNLLSGEKLVYLNFSGDLPNFWPDILLVPESSRQNQIFYAGKVERKILTANISHAAPGYLALDIKGQIAGVLNSGQVIPADAIKTAAQLYLNSKTIHRPDFEFTYKQLSAKEAAILGLKQGPIVASVSNKSSQLKAGDEIVSINGQELKNNVFLEEVLEKYKPEESVVFSILREKNRLDITIKPKELK